VREKKFTFLRTKFVKEAEEAKKKLDAARGDKSKLTQQEREALELAPLGTGIKSNNPQNGIVRVTYTPEEGKSKIIVECINGSSFSVNVDKFTTAAEIKQVIARETSIPVSCLQLNRGCNENNALDDTDNAKQLLFSDLHVILKKSSNRLTALENCSADNRSKFVITVKVQLPNTGAFCNNLLELSHYAGDTVKSLVQNIGKHTGSIFKPDYFYCGDGVVTYASHKDQFLREGATYIFDSKTGLEKDFMQIYVQNLQNRTIIFDVHPSESIKSVKYKIFEKIGIEIRISLLGCKSSFGNILKRHRRRSVGFCFGFVFC